MEYSSHAHPGFCIRVHTLLILGFAFSWSMIWGDIFHLLTRVLISRTARQTCMIKNNHDGHFIWIMHLIHSLSWSDWRALFYIVWIALSCLSQSIVCVDVFMVVMCTECFSFYIFIIITYVIVSSFCGSALLNVTLVYII